MKSIHYQLIRLIPFITILFFTSCDNKDVVVEHQEDNDIIEVMECAYNKNNDISDSLIMMYEEILDKKGDYNQAKFDVNIENWTGKSFKIENLSVKSINIEDEYLGNYVILQYGEKFKHNYLPVTIDIFVDMNSKKEMSKFEIDEIVSLNAVIGSGRSNKMGYTIHTDCGEILKR